MMSRSVLMLGTALILPASTDAATPMSYLHTFGPAGDPATRLGWGLGIISVAVSLIVAALLLGAIFRRRKALPANDHSLVVRRDAGGMPWIYIGVGVSTVVLAVCMIWTLVVIAQIARPAHAPAFTVEVTASQWWWALRYDAKTSSQTFTTANEIHIPVGQPVRFALSSPDVIHSFWVPKLGGKMDIIPGQTNITWLQADKAGVYRGQCAVFCGMEHARMAMLVIAQAPKDFEAWRESQVSDSPPPGTVIAQAGQQIFQAHCAACHTIRGTNAAGLVGPDLSHLMSRQTLAAGVLPNTPEHLADWIVHAQRIKPDSHMPDQKLSDPQLAAVMAYLQTLR